MKNKILILSPKEDKQIEIKAYNSIQISKSLSSKLGSFSLDVQVFDENNIKEFGIGSIVKIYSTDTDETITENHLIYKGVVNEAPRLLDGELKKYNYRGLSLLSRTQSILVRESYIDVKISDIVFDLITKYNNGLFEIGYIENVDYTLTIPFQNIHLYSALESLANAIGFTFEIDLNNKFNFYSKASRTNNTSIKMNDFFKGSAEFGYDIGSLVNSLVVYGGISLSPDITQIIKGDDLNQTFLLNYKPRKSSSGSIQVLLNGTPLRVGIEGLSESDVDCLINFQEKTITILDENGQKRILLSSETLEITYRYEFKLIHKIKDDASIEKYGLYEDVIKFPQITDKIALIDRAKEHLKKYANPILNGSLSTWRNTWNEGENVKIEIQTENGFFVNDWLQVSQKNISITPEEALKVNLKFEQKKGLDNILKNLKERIEDLERKDENEKVEDLSFTSDKVFVHSLFKVSKNSNSFKIGSSVVGSKI